MKKIQKLAVALACLMLFALPAFGQQIQEPRFHLMGGVSYTIWQPADCPLCENNFALENTGFGLGVDYPLGDNFTAGVLGIYQPNREIFMPALTVGYRIADSPVSIGPFVGIAVNNGFNGGVNQYAGQFSGGALVTVELTK